MVILEVYMFFLTSTLSPNVKIQVHLRMFMVMLKMVVLIFVLNVVFKTGKLSPNVKMQVPLRRSMGVLKRVMVILLVDMFL